MLISRVFEVRDSDTVGAIRRFLERLLDQKIVDLLVAPVDISHGQASHPQVIADQRELNIVNPLLPIMLDNSASVLREALLHSPDARLAAVLRPCEVRTVVELAKRQEIDTHRVVIIGVDCLATFDADYYRDVIANHPDDPYWLMHEALRFARIGQIAPDRYRAACQLCDRPAADYDAADILLGLIGGKPSQQILLLAKAETDTRLGLHRIADRRGTETDIVRRELAIWRLSERRKWLTDHKLECWNLQTPKMEATIGTLLQRCSLCGECISACPLGNGVLRCAIQQGRDAFINAYTHQESRMISCVGCGMCQTHCPENIPLSAINTALSHRAQTSLGYVPGRSLSEQLPEAGRPSE